MDEGALTGDLGSSISFSVFDLHLFGDVVEEFTV